MFSKALKSIVTNDGLRYCLGIMLIPVAIIVVGISMGFNFFSIGKWIAAALAVIGISLISSAF